MPSVFVPGRLVNPLNGAHGHWAKAAAYRKRWREAVYVAVVCTPHRGPPFQLVGNMEAKRLTLTASTWATMDDDGLVASLKPCRDGCVDAGLIHSDAPDSGHVIEYAQKIDRKRRGVEISWQTL